MAATDKQLGNLHALVAEGLAADLAAANEIEDPAVRAATIKEVRAQAIAFLKNNNITAELEVNKGLQDLKEELAAKRRKAPAAGLAEAMAEFERMNPGGLPS